MKYNILDTINLITDSDLAWILILAECLSGLGALFIIICYYRYRNLRNFAFTLVSYLSQSDLMKSVTVLVGTTVHLERVNDIGCQIEGFLFNFSQLASILWTFVISYCVKQSLQNPESGTFLSQRLYYFVACVFGSSFVISLLPAITGDYGPVHFY